MSPIGQAGLRLSLSEKPVSGIPSVPLKAEATNSVECSKNGCQYNERLKRRCYPPDFLSSPILSSLRVFRNLFPYVYKIFHPKILKFVGRVLPWPRLNHLMDIAEAMDAQARGVYETKKRLLESGDDATAKQVGEGKDLISLLSACDLCTLSDHLP